MTIDRYKLPAVCVVFHQRPTGEVWAETRRGVSVIGRIEGSAGEVTARSVDGDDLGSQDSPQAALYALALRELAGRDDDPAAELRDDLRQALGILVAHHWASELADYERNPAGRDIHVLHQWKLVRQALGLDAS